MSIVPMDMDMYCIYNCIYLMSWSVDFVLCAPAVCGPFLVIYICIGAVEVHCVDLGRELPFGTVPTIGSRYRGGKSVAMKKKGGNTCDGGKEAGERRLGGQLEQILST